MALGPQVFTQLWRFELLSMDKEWNEYVAEDCDVIVSLVQRSTSISASASANDQGSLAMDEDRARKRKRLSNLGEYEQHLADVHMNSSRLRRCSKYFEACLSERWAGGAEISASSESPVHLTLDVHTCVESYRDCFSRMYFRKYKCIPDIYYCLELVQVASQISYLELVEDCVRYLISIPWSLYAEKRIHQFAHSMFYPSACAGDLSARLRLAFTDKEKLGPPLDITEHALWQRLHDFLRYGLDYDEACCKQLFSSGFRLINAGPCQTSSENVLQHVSDYLKTILEAKEHAKSKERFYNMDESFTLLLETGSAKGLVEYIVHESPLCEMLKTSPALRQHDWIYCIFVVFERVIEGLLLLKTLTRYKLIKQWTWVLLLQADKGYRPESESSIYKVLSAFVMTFPYEVQKEVISAWMAYYTNPSEAELNLPFAKIHKDWLARLEKEVSSREPDDQPHMNRP